jgi:hypothetical protein
MNCDTPCTHCTVPRVIAGRCAVFASDRRERELDFQWAARAHWNPQGLRGLCRAKQLDQALQLLRCRCSTDAPMRRAQCSRSLVCFDMPAHARRDGVRRSSSCFRSPSAPCACELNPPLSARCRESRARQERTWRSSRPSRTWGPVARCFILLFSAHPPTPRPCVSWLAAWE